MIDRKRGLLLQRMYDDRMNYGGEVKNPRVPKPPREASYPVPMDRFPPMRIGR